MILNFIEKLNNLKKFPYYVVTPLPYAIGTAANQLGVGVRRSASLNKKILLIVPTILQKTLKYKICNKCFFSDLEITELNKIDKIIKKFFFILINIHFFFTRIFVLFNDKFLKLKLKESFRFLEIGVHYDFDKSTNFEEVNHFQQKKINIKLSANTTKYCSEKIKQLGIHKDDKFVCIHLRDSFYRDDFGKRDVRNSNINNYRKTIAFLLKKNYWVIRLGQSNKKFKINHKKFIDYPSTILKDDCLDLYIIKNCQFMICSASGLYSIAILFNKPILLTDNTRLFQYRSSNKFSRVIFKRPFWKKNKKFIPLKTYSKLPYFYHHLDYLDNEIGYKENSSLEIYKAVKEFLYSLKSNSNNKLNRIQTNFNKFLFNSLKEHYYSRSKKNGTNLIDSPEAFDIINSLKAGRDSYCSFFLKKYFK